MDKKENYKNTFITSWKIYLSGRQILGYVNQRGEERLQKNAVGS